MGLQNLRWDCHTCEKQCCDENGFKCHCLSESHQRQILIFGENLNRVIERLSFPTMCILVHKTTDHLFLQEWRELELFPVTSISPRFASPTLPSTVLCRREPSLRKLWCRKAHRAKEDPCCYKEQKLQLESGEQQKLKKHGHEPDPIQFFYDKHTRNDEEKTWIDEVAERTHAGMQEKLAEIVAVEGNETTEMRERVRGYGLGVIPNMVPYLQIDGSSSSYRSYGRHYANLQSQVMELESPYQQQEEQAQVQQVQTQEQLLQTQRELAMLKQMIQSQQSTPPSQQSSQPLQQPSFQMPSYPPQMYWPQPQIYPQMPYQPQHAYPTTGLTGLLMGDTSVQENDLLNQLRASSNQSSRGSEQ